VGLLDIFKGKKKEENIDFSDIDAWLSKQVESKHLDITISRAKNAVKELVEEGHRGLEALEKAVLMNENITVREKQIMEGHRRVYIQRLKKFLTELDVPDDFSRVGHYAARFSEALGELSQETHKNYLVLSQFMESELARVVRAVKNIERELSTLQREIDNEGVDMIKEAKIRLRHFVDDDIKKRNLENDRIAKENELELVRKKKEKIEARLAELKQSREYADLKEVIDAKKRNEEEINSIEQEMITTFAELNRPLKKFTHNAPHENFADKYIADPAGALEEDDSLIIHDLLKKLDSELENLGLKDRQLEKTRDMIGRLTKEYLIKQKIDLGRLKQANKETATRINKSVVALNISENESWLKSMEKKIGQIEEEIHTIEKQIEEINLDYLKQKVKEKIKEIAAHVNVVE
jgi:hypothetical protein